MYDEPVEVCVRWGAWVRWVEDVLYNTVLYVHTYLRRECREREKGKERGGVTVSSYVKDGDIQNPPLPHTNHPPILILKKKKKKEKKKKAECSYLYVYICI